MKIENCELKIENEATGAKTMNQVIFTNGIPICPVCQAPTIREYIGSSRTLMGFMPKYDQNGININPDRNIQTDSYVCHNCELQYNVKGNQHDGWEYQYKEQKP